MKTRGGVYYNIEESEYKLIKGDYVFYFSSMLYKNKFEKGLDSFVKEQNDRLYSIYGYEGDFSEYLTIIFYKKVEKRGFYVTYKEKAINPLFFKYGDVYGN